MQTRPWQKKESGLFDGTLGKGQVLDSLFLNRGFSSTQSAQEFLAFKLKDLKDPLSLLGMDKAVERLKSAFMNNESVAIYGDFDMDGTPALALMVRGLRALGYERISHCQPDRHKDGYGFHGHLVERLKADHQVDVIVTVDVGITDHEAVQTAKELGVDVIISDHHQVKEKAPEALAVVNPNQPDCTSEMSYLCGTGVAFYIILGLRRELAQSGVVSPGFDIKDLLDCFAIGTVADMVPLIKENRILTKHGMKTLEATKMVGIRTLMQSLGLYGKPLGASDVGIRLAPKLNSLTRIESDIKPIDLFLVETESEAQSMVEHVVSHNKKRVSLLKEAEHLCESMVADMGERPSYFLYSEKFHKGLVGLLATRITQNTGRASFVGSLKEKEGLIVGSARAPEGEGLSVFAALTECQQHLNQFGGHPAAAGFELNVDQAEAFGESLEDYFVERIDEEAVQPFLYDETVSFLQLKQFMSQWEELEPFGVSFESPVFCLEGLTLKGVKELKGGHLRLDFVQGQQPFQALWFFPDEPEMVLDHLGESFSLLGEPQWNHYLGTKKLQVLVKQLKRTY